MEAAVAVSSGLLFSMTPLPGPPSAASRRRHYLVPKYIFLTHKVRRTGVLRSQLDGFFQAISQEQITNHAVHSCPAQFDQLLLQLSILNHPLMVNIACFFWRHVALCELSQKPTEVVFEGISCGARGGTCHVTSLRRHLSSESGLESRLSPIESDERKALAQ